MSDPLTVLGHTYGTDKAGSYTQHYHNLLKPYRETVKNVLELGVYKGASLQMWSKYFYMSNIHGVDINLDRVDPSLKENKKIFLYNHNATNKSLLGVIPKLNYDIILDDAGHRTSAQMQTLDMLIHLVTPRGFYIIEDMHTSFMEQFIDTPHTSYDVLRNWETLGSKYLSKLTLDKLAQATITWIEETPPPPAGPCAMVIQVN